MRQFKNINIDGNCKITQMGNDISYYKNNILYIGDINYPTFIYNLSATTFYGNLDWDYIINTPTTLSEYGITDAYNISGGTSEEFVKGDGTLDSNDYITSGEAPVQSVNTQTGDIVLDSDNINEGVNNLYSQWDNATGGISYSGGNVGIGTTTPVYKLDVYGTSATDAIRTYSGLDIKSVETPVSITGTLQSGAGLEIGEYYYRVSYITDLGESNPKISGVITTTSGNQQILLNLPVSDDPRVTGRKIYRTKADGQNYLMGTITTITNNTDTTYLDSIPDANLTNFGWEAYYKVNSTTNYITVNGTSAMMLDTQRTSFGFGAGANNEGGENAYVGYYSGKNSSGSRQAFFGSKTGINAVGDKLTFIGDDAGGYAEADESVCVGGHAGFFLNGNQSIFIGQFAGYTSGAKITGSRNTAIGYFALANYNVDFTGCYNIFLGYMSGRQTEQLMSASNSIAIGKDTYTTKSNQIVLGNNDIVETLLNGNVGIGTTNPSYKLDVNGNIKGSYYSSDGTQGITTTQTFKDGDNTTRTMTIKNGIITDIS